MTNKSFVELERTSGMDSPRGSLWGAILNETITVQEGSQNGDHLEEANIHAFYST